MLAAERDRPGVQQQPCGGRTEIGRVRRGACCVATFRVATLRVAATSALLPSALSPAALPPSALLPSEPARSGPGPAPCCEDRRSWRSGRVVQARCNSSAPHRKSSIAIASSGLCEPCSLRTKIMALGMPALANTAASWPAPLGIGSSGSAISRRVVRSRSIQPGSIRAGAESSLRSKWNVTPRSSAMPAHSERNRS